MKQGVKQTYLSFIVEGYDTYIESADKYTNVRRIEVIARTEREALHKAKQLIKCPYYKVWAVCERYVDTK